jgi:hypothetical protein
MMTNIEYLMMFNREKKTLFFPSLTTTAEVGMIELHHETPGMGWKWEITCSLSLVAHSGFPWSKMLWHMSHLECVLHTRPWRGGTFFFGTFHSHGHANAMYVHSLPFLCLTPTPKHTSGRLWPSICGKRIRKLYTFGLY